MSKLEPPDFTVALIYSEANNNVETPYLWVRYGQQWFEVNLRDQYRFTGELDEADDRIVALPTATPLTADQWRRQEEQRFDLAAFDERRKNWEPGLFDAGLVLPEAERPPDD